MITNDTSHASIAAEFKKSFQSAQNKLNIMSVIETRDFDLQSKLLTLMYKEKERTNSSPLNKLQYDVELAALTAEHNAAMECIAAKHKTEMNQVMATFKARRVAADNARKSRAMPKIPSMFAILKACFKRVRITRLKAINIY